MDRERIGDGEAQPRAQRIGWPPPRPLPPSTTLAMVGCEATAAMRAWRRLRGGAAVVGREAAPASMGRRRSSGGEDGRRGGDRAANTGEETKGRERLTGGSHGVFHPNLPRWRATWVKSGK